MGIGGIGLASLGEHPEDLVLELDPDLDDIGIAHGVDPERQPDLAGDFLGEDLVEDREKRLGPRRGQVAGRFYGDVELQPFAGDPDDVVIGGVLRIGGENIDDRRNIAGHGHGEPLGHGLPVPLHEHEGDDRLQQNHWNDDDQQRTGIEPSRNAACEAAQTAWRIPFILPANGIHAGHALAPHPRLVCAAARPPAFLLITSAGGEVLGFVENQVYKRGGTDPLPTL